MPPKVQIFFSDEQKRKALSGKQKPKAAKAASAVGKAAGAKKAAKPVLTTSRPSTPGSNTPKGKGKKPVVVTGPVVRVKGVASPAPKKRAPAQRVRDAVVTTIRPVKAAPRVGGGPISAQPALQTARVIASTPSHPSHADVAELLNTYERGWIDEQKFSQLLHDLIF